MGIVKKILILLVCGLALVACAGRNDDEVLAKLQKIQEFGRGGRANLALARLDSLTEEVEECSRYVRMKSCLLKARLQYKATIKPVSDKEIKRLVDYFATHGSAREQQEVYYAAGCVYYELNDAPQAIEQYRRSEYIAEHAAEECDSALLRLTYSCLCYLYSCMQIRPACLEYAKKEYSISERFGQRVPTNLEHLAHSYADCDSVVQAAKYYDMALKEQWNEKTRDFFVASKLLQTFVETRQIGKADSAAVVVFDMLRKKKATPFSNSYLSVGEYCLMKGDVDSAAVCLERVLAERTDQNDMYDASKALYRIYMLRGDLKRAAEYAGVFVTVNDSLIFGKRQKKAASVTNWYQYARDKEESMRLEQENEEYRRKQALWWGGSLSLAMVLAAAFLFYRARQKYKLAMQMETIRNIGQEKDEVEERLKAKSAADDSVKEGIRTITELLHEKELVLAEKVQALAESERALAEKTQENKSLKLQLRRLKASVTRLEKKLGKK